jgi:hypothetical protein
LFYGLQNYKRVKTFVIVRLHVLIAFFTDVFRPETYQ